eukprot:m.794021 g.794021  ORF g.794021 m.794021 type:complete len:1092 (-) comp59236_c0_seq3:2035-5310(-)
MADNSFVIEHAKTARAGCKECKQKIDRDSLRIGKVTVSPFGGEDDKMTVYYHVACIFKSQLRSRATTKKVEDFTDLEGFSLLTQPERDEVKKLIAQFNTDFASKHANKKPAKPKQTTLSAMVTSGNRLSVSPQPPPSGASSHSGDERLVVASDADRSDDDSAAPAVANEADVAFESFTSLCERVGAESSYTNKSKIIQQFIERGSSGIKFTGDVHLVLRLLLPLYKKRVYNMKDKQLVKALSSIFHCSLDAMVLDLEQGDCAETAVRFFETNMTYPPKAQSMLRMAEVDAWLENMAGLTKMEDQQEELRKLVKKCTAMDLRYVMRQLKHDLRIFAGPKHVLTALDPDAYEAFQASNDLRDVVDRVLARNSSSSRLTKKLSVRANLMTAIKPMLAEACRGVKAALAKAPFGLFAEIKYDGERVQVHKSGNIFQFFSRSLKPVTRHKIEFFENEIGKACPHGDSMILDAEVLLIDTKTHKPLPFTSLGIHKRKAFSDAQPCLFIFDILQFNGQDLMSKPMSERRSLMLKHVTEVENRIMYSESQLITNEADLQILMTKVMNEGLEGLVLKPLDSVYEPGKRHWMKMKKDYLKDGSMADSADLVVLGAYYGTGTKGGIMSTFLMGCRDTNDKWRTVCKVSNGHDDATLDRLNKEIAVVKISKDPTKVPNWLVINKNDLVPDFVVADVKNAPVWEIIGAEFSASNSHSADGISIRFPRVTKIRDDKDWQDATTLDELKKLFATSKQHSDVKGAQLRGSDDEEEEEEPASDSGAGSKLFSHFSSAPKATSVVTSRAADDDDDVPFNPVRVTKPAPSTISSAPPVSQSHTTVAKRKPKTTPAQKPKRRRRADSEDSEDPDDHGSDLEDFIVDDDEDDEEEDADYYSDDSTQQPRARSTYDAPKSRRSCKWGAACYRKNADHRQDFAHPGDSDFQDFTTSGSSSASTVQTKLTSLYPVQHSHSTMATSRSPSPVPAPRVHQPVSEPVVQPQPQQTTQAAQGPTLLDLFSSKVLWVSKAHPRLRELKRVVVAYDGDISHNETDNAVTHVIVETLDPSQWPVDVSLAVSKLSEARVVTSEWVFKCAEAKKLVSDAPFALI